MFIFLGNSTGTKGIFGAAKKSEKRVGGTPGNSSKRHQNDQEASPALSDQREVCIVYIKRLLLQFIGWWELISRNVVFFLSILCG